MKRPATAVAALTLLALMAACVPLKGEPPPGRPDVTLWGDSFGETVAPLLPYSEHFHSGTAPCDWVNSILEAPAPRTAVLLFVGNKLADGACDYPSAVSIITTSLEARGSRVIWVAAPLLPVNPQARTTLNSIYPEAAHGPADAIGGNVWLAAYRGPDNNHLNELGASVFALAIQEVVS